MSEDSELKELMTQLRGAYGIKDDSPEAVILAARFHLLDAVELLNQACAAFQKDNHPSNTIAGMAAVTVDFLSTFPQMDVAVLDYMAALQFGIQSLLDQGLPHKDMKTLSIN